MKYSLRSLMIVVTLAALACGWWRHRQYCVAQANAHWWKEIEGEVVGNMVATSGWTTEEDYERELADPERVAARQLAKVHGQLKEAYFGAVWQPWRRFWIVDTPLPEDAP